MDFEVVLILFVTVFRIAVDRRSLIGFFEPTGERFERCHRLAASAEGKSHANVYRTKADENVAQICKSAAYATRLGDSLYPPQR